MVSDGGGCSLLTRKFGAIYMFVEARGQSCRMGTHPSGPAMLAADPTVSLQTWLEQHSEALGATVLKRFGLKLPFLFKVCCIVQAATVSKPEACFVQSSNL